MHAPSLHKKLKIREIDDRGGDGGNITYVRTVRDASEDPALHVSRRTESAFRGKPFQPALPRLASRIARILSRLVTSYLRLFQPTKSRSEERLKILPWLASLASTVASSHAESNHSRGDY